MNSEQKGKVVITAMGVMAVATIVVIVVAVSLALTRQCDRSPASEAQRFKKAIDSKIDNVQKPKDKEFKYTRFEINEAQDLTALNSLKPMAFLHGLRPFASNIQGGRSTIRTWITQDGQKKSQIVNGMTYSHGTISVPESGICQVIFHAMLHYEGIRGDCKNISLDVIRYNAVTQKEEVICRDKREMCPEADGEASDYLSHFHSLAMLKAGDQIYVNISDLSLLKWYRDDHYFQIYLI